MQGAMGLDLKYALENERFGKFTIAAQDESNWASRWISLWERWREGGRDYTYKL